MSPTDQLRPRSQAGAEVSSEKTSARTITVHPPHDNRESSHDDSVVYFEDLDAAEDQQFLRTEKRVSVRRSALPKKTANRVKKAVLIAAALASAGMVAGMTYQYGTKAARFRLESSDNIIISGGQNASRGQVMEIAGADIGRNIFFIPLEERKRQLEEIPWVESATVMRLLPNRLAISLQERVPVAFIRTGSKINLIDAHGVIMGLAGKQAKYSFPVIEGIAENEPLSSRAAIMKIYNRLIQEFDSAGPGEPAHSKDLSEVDLSDREDVKITVNGSGGNVLIHLGTSDFLARYQIYLAHIAEWRQQFPNMQSVDLRYDGQIVVDPDVGKKTKQKR